MGTSRVLNAVGRVWVPLVVVTAVALGGIAVARLRGVFGSEAIFSVNGRNAEPLAPFHVKTVVYEVYGPSGTSGTVDYLGSNAQPQQAQFTGLPWSMTVTTTSPAVIADVVAQGDSEHLGCRITINGVVKDEQAWTGHSAQTFCLVKAG